MDNLAKGIGERLRERRKELKYTQSEAAELLEMSTNFYGQIERGESKPALDKIILIKERLGLDPTYLLTGESGPQVTFSELISDCPKDKIFDMEQIIRYACNLYRK